MATSIEILIAEQYVNCTTTTCKQPAGKKCITTAKVIRTPHAARLASAQFIIKGQTLRDPEVATLKTTIASLQTALDQANAKVIQTISANDIQVTSLQAQISSLQSQLASANRTIASDQQALASQSVDLENMQNTVGILEARIEELLKNIDGGVVEDPSKFVEALDMTSKARMLTPGVGASNYWRKHFMNPDGENGKYRVHGGLDRDMPLERLEAVPDWAMVDARVEISWAKQAGLDGFLGCLLSVPGSTTGNWDRAVTMSKAAAEDGEFRYTPLLDCTATSFVSRTVQAVAADLVTLYKIGAARKVDGEYLLHSFYAQNKTVQWWTDLKAELARLGYPVKVVTVLLTYNKSLFTQYAPHSWAMGVWGPERPGTVAGIETLADHVHSLGKKWLAPVRLQGARPRDDNFAEAENTTLARLMWEQARKVGDMVQIITWDDIDETTHIIPTIGSEFGPVDFTAHFVKWFKTGREPVVTEDKIFLTHRKHFWSAKPTLTGLNPMKPTLDGTSVPRDTTEAFILATAPGTAMVNGQEFPVSAGTNIITVPLILGRQAVQLKRNGQVVAQVASRNPVIANPETQDLTYYFTVS
jgi:hypothetical protein